VVPPATSVPLVPCNQASLTNGTCTICCGNGQQIVPHSNFDCCNNASATCCQDPTTCKCPAGCPSDASQCIGVAGCWPYATN
jgi:hypothetical protein